MVKKELTVIVLSGFALEILNIFLRVMLDRSTELYGLKIFSFYKRFQGSLLYVLFCVIINDENCIEDSN